MRKKERQGIKRLLSITLKETKKINNLHKRESMKMIVRKRERHTGKREK